MTNAEMIQASFAAAELIELDVEMLAALARMDQMEEVQAAEARGDNFAAYWAGSASASVVAHYRRGAFHTVAA